jgi:hypothetical protein
LAKSGRVAKVAVAAGVLGCLGVAAAAQAHPAGPGSVSGMSFVVDHNGDRASRSATRQLAGTLPGLADVKTNLVLETKAQKEAKREAQAKAEAAKAAAEKAAKEEAERKAAEAAAAAQRAVDAKAAAIARASSPMAPVAGLSQQQMDNAQHIVKVGIQMDLPKRAYVMAVACAMQESNLYNLASTVLPESYNYANQGSGSDHDSIGLFQQRPSSGWGSIAQIMQPDYAASAFYQRLQGVDGWQNMALTWAVQAVQVSAYPLAYASHEAQAQQVVDAIVGP